MGQRRGVSRACWVVLYVAAALAAACTAPSPADDLLIIDGHIDLPETLLDAFDNRLARVDLAASRSPGEPPRHADLPRMREGKLGAFFSVAYVPSRVEGPPAATAMFAQMDVTHRLVARYPQHLALATSAEEIEAAHRAGRIAVLVGIEGGHTIANSLPVLRSAFACGARYLTLTHWGPTDWADAATSPPRHGGLTEFGREVLREMNRLGMMIDLSHVSDAVMRDALAVSAAPVIFSHSSARALCNHPRNVPDDILALVAANGGIVMVNFAPAFVSEEVRLAEAPAEAEWARLEALFPTDTGKVMEGMRAFRQTHPLPKATLAQVADHIEHIRRVAGLDHVGLGSDFEGISATPEGLEDVSRYPALLAELARRGWSRQELRKVAGDNLLRVMREVAAVAARLAAERQPSEAAIGDFPTAGTAVAP